MSIYTKEHSRYPRTFACDWVRELVGLDSRGDAAKWIKRLAEWKGVAPEQIHRDFADQYINHYGQIAKLNEAKQLAAERWQRMDKVLTAAALRQDDTHD